MSKCHWYIVYGILTVIVTVNANHQNIKIREKTQTQNNYEVGNKIKEKYYPAAEISRIEQILSKVEPEKLNKTKTLFDHVKTMMIKLSRYDNHDLKHVIGVMLDEIGKYHYRACKFHELIDIHGFRKFIATKLNDISNLNADKLRNGLFTIADRLKSKKFEQYEKEFVDFINSIYRQDVLKKIKKLINKFDAYRFENANKNKNIKQTIKELFRTVFFDHYTELNLNARIELKTKLRQYWNTLKKRLQVLSNDDKTTVKAKAENNNVIFEKNKKIFNAIARQNQESIPTIRSAYKPESDSSNDVTEPNVKKVSLMKQYTMLLSGRTLHPVHHETATARTATTKSLIPTVPEQVSDHRVFIEVMTMKPYVPKRVGPLKNFRYQVMFKKASSNTYRTVTKKHKMKFKNHKVGILLPDVSSIFKEKHQDLTAASKNKHVEKITKKVLRANNEFQGTPGEFAFEVPRVNDKLEPFFSKRSNDLTTVTPIIGKNFLKRLRHLEDEFKVVKNLVTSNTEIRDLKTNIKQKELRHLFKKTTENADYKTEKRVLGVELSDYDSENKWQEETLVNIKQPRATLDDDGQLQRLDRIYDSYRNSLKKYVDKETYAEYNKDLVTNTNYIEETGKDDWNDFVKKQSQFEFTRRGNNKIANLTDVDAKYIAEIYENEKKSNNEFKKYKLKTNNTRKFAQSNVEVKTSKNVILKNIRDSKTIYLNDVFNETFELKGNIPTDKVSSKNEDIVKMNLKIKGRNDSFLTDDKKTGKNINSVAKKSYMNTKNLTFTESSSMNELISKNGMKNFDKNSRRTILDNANIYKNEKAANGNIKKEDQNKLKANKIPIQNINRISADNIIKSSSIYIKNILADNNNNNKKESVSFFKNKSLDVTTLANIDKTKYVTLTVTKNATLYSQNKTVKVNGMRSASSNFNSRNVGNSSHELQYNKKQLNYDMQRLNNTDNKNNSSNSDYLSKKTADKKHESNNKRRSLKNNVTEIRNENVLLNDSKNYNTTFKKENIGSDSNHNKHVINIKVLARFHNTITEKVNELNENEPNETKPIDNFIRGPETRRNMNENSSVEDSRIKPNNNTLSKQEKEKARDSDMEDIHVNTKNKTSIIVNNVVSVNATNTKQSDSNAPDGNRI